jgi:tetratricopeptide (TPR) repeat protein
MNKKRNTVLIIGGGIIGLVILLFLIIYINNNKYISRIPGFPDSSVISPAVQEQIADAVKKAQQNPSAKNLGELGMVFHSSANFNEAAQCYQLAIERGKSDWIWNYYLGYLYKELGESDKVIENFNRVVELKPDADLAWYYLGEAYRSLMKVDLSERAFSRIANKNNTKKEKTDTRNDHFPLSVYAMYKLSNIYVESGRLALAEETINKLLDQSDIFGQAYRILSSIYFTKGDKTLGERFSIRANDLLLSSTPLDVILDKLALMSRSELFLLKLIDDAKYSGYYDWALRLVEQGLKYFPDNEYLVLKAVDIYLSNNLFKEAANIAAQHSNTIGNNYNCLMTLGAMFFQKGIYAEAPKYWSKGLNLNPAEGFVYKNMAMCLYKTGEKQKIQEMLTAAAKINQENAENLADIVFAFFQFEETDKANEYVAILKQKAPQGPKVQKLYGKIAETKGDLPTAINMYESSFKGNSNDTETISFFGNLLFANKMWDKYIGFYEEAVKFNPNDPDILEKLSTFYVTCPNEKYRNLEEGIIYSLRAFSHKFSTPQVKISSGRNLAVALATIGDKQNALNILQKTINVSQGTDTPQNVKQELEQLYQEIQKL